jgi:hypothetical protein
MFFTTLIAAPILAGLVAGVWSGRRVVPATLSGICLALGLVGAIASAFEADGRADNITFSFIASVACAALVWGGYAVGRVSRRSAVRSA